MSGEAMAGFEVERLGKALTALTKLRIETGAQLDVYGDAHIRIGDEGIVFRLSWDDAVQQYTIEEQLQ